MHKMAALLHRKYVFSILILSGLLWNTRADFSDFEDYKQQFSTQYPDHATRGMLPFGPEFYDSENDIENNVELDIDFTIPFMGNRYNKAYMSLNGFVSFGDAYAFQSKVQFPNKNYGLPGEEDPPMISVYYGKGELNGNHPVDTQKMFTRTVDPSRGSDVEREIAEGLLSHIRTDIRWNVMGASDFMPSYALVLTWKGLPFAGCGIGLAGLECPAFNTYQAVIATDQQRTFVLLNYYNTVWENAITEQCSFYGLTDNDHLNCFSAQAGFNEGQGRYFYPLPFSHTPDVTRLSSIGGSDGRPQPGRFFYQVTHPTVTSGSCLNQNDMIPEWPIEIYPNSGSMLGGFEVHISGSCLGENDEVKCRIGSEYAEMVDGYVVDELRAGCLVPPLTQTGELPVYLYLRGSTTPSHTSSLHIEHPDRWRWPVILEDKEEWRSLSPETLSLSWNPQLLNMSLYSMENSTEQEIMVDISLFGYREEEVDGVMKVTWHFLHSLAMNMPNSGSFAFSPADHQCEGSDCDWQLGGVKVSVTMGIEPLGARGLWSPPTTLGWYVNTAMGSANGEDWPYAKCMEWKDEQEVEAEEEESWEEELIPCPCRLEQAYADRSGYSVDSDCDLTKPTAPCPLHPTASHCFLSNQPTPRGASSSCCYNGEGHLMYAGDSVEGSFSGRVHPDGVYPYGSAGKVPSLSHWLTDKLPFLWCCEWAEEKSGCIEHFMEKRPTPGCLPDTEPAHAFAFGDPHFSTFDGYEYTFNGRGEFHLLDAQIPETNHFFNLQARMEPPNFLNAEEIKATSITAVAMHPSRRDAPSENVPHVEFHLSPTDIGQEIHVYVNGEYQDFSPVEVTSKEYFGTGELSNVRAVIKKNYPTPDPYVPTNFTVTFSSGIAVTVARTFGMLQITTTIPTPFWDKTTGLFGKWNGNPKDDLYTRDGKLFTPVNTQQIFEVFGKNWEVTLDESAFTYFAAMGYEYFRDPDFVPNFEPEFPNVPGNNVTDSDVTDVCGSNSVCVFDYKSTLSANIGESSMTIQAWAKQVSEMSAPVTSCGRPDIEFAHFMANHYLLGGKIEFSECDEGYKLQGNDMAMCEHSGEWGPSLDGTRCKSQKEIDSENSKMAAAIAVPITLLVLVAIIVVAFIFIKKRRDKDESGRQSPSQKQPPPQAARGLSQYPEPHPDGSTMGSRTHSTSSVGSVILTEDIKRQRPARPTETKPKLTRPDQNANGQVAYNNRPDITDDIQIDTTRQYPHSGYGRPVYDNVGADLEPDDHRSAPPQLPTVPPPQEGYDNDAIEADAPYPQPGRGLYQGNYNPGSDTAV